MKNKKLKIIYLQLIICASLFQNYVVSHSSKSITPFFIDGVPLVHSAATHTILLGYWFIPIFFIVMYFSEYISDIDDYRMILMMRYGRTKYYILKLFRMICDLFVITGIQLFVYLCFSHFQWNFTMIHIIQYFTVLLLIILLENVLELLFVRMKNINMFMNVFILASIIIYNFTPIMRNGIFKLMNMLMIARIPSLTILDICILVVLLIICIGLMWIILKKKDLLGDRKYD